MLKLIIGLIFLFTVQSSFGGNADFIDSKNEIEAEYNDLLSQIKNRETDSIIISRLKREALSEHALVWETDKTPLDIIVRRTEILLSHLSENNGSQELGILKQRLEKISENKEGLNKEDEKAQKALFANCFELRREIAFSNSLLDFDELLFMKHNKMRRGERHMVDQYEGFNAARGGGIFVLKNPFGEKPELKNLLQDKVVKNGRLKGQS
jgi:hypothetical protein